MTASQRDEARPRVPAPRTSAAADAVRAEKLAGVLAEFAERLVTGFQVQEILDHLVLRIVDLLPVTGAGVMLIRTSGDLHFVAASDGRILEIETLQNDLGEGPCLESYRSGTAISVPDLAVDARFPRFSQGAREAGLVAVFTLPMSINGRRFGALDLYRTQSGELDKPTMDAAQVLANVAAAYLHYAHDRAETADTLDLMRQRSLHDALTGLPNRVLLRERLEQAIARTRRSRKLVAVLFVDLDHFKAVNDDHGHHVGDEVLVAVGKRMSSIVRSGETVARLAGDEFVIVCEDLDDVSQAERIADKIARAIALPYDIEDGTLVVTASIGVAFCGPGNAVPDTLIQDADVAMYQAKQAGGGSHRLLHQGRVAAQRHTITVRDLRATLEDDGLQLAYQPIVGIGDNVMNGMEALLRWQHPELGWVAPGSVVRLAESTDLMVRLGSWVLARACRDFQRWREEYGVIIPHVTVNVSPVQILEPDFARTVSHVLATAGMEPSDLLLEITEDVFLHDGSHALAALQDVRRLGVGIVLDDFGTGYSSLNYLRRFPFSVLKIDQAFVSTLATDDQNRTIVAAVIDLAHGLDLTVVAEGVETLEQLEELRRLGADRVQGYHYSRPLLADDFEHSLLKHSNSRPVQLPVAAAR